MSWSFNAIGKAPAVLNKARKELPALQAPEPEKTIIKKFGDILEAVLIPTPDNVAIKIEAAGSQYSPGDGKVISSFSIKIESIYGFVE